MGSSIVNIKFNALLALDISIILIILLDLLLRNLLIKLVSFLLHFLEYLDISRLVIDLFFTHIVHVRSNLILCQNSVIRIYCHLILRWNHVDITRNIIIIRRQLLRKLLLQLFVLENQVVAEVVFFAIHILGSVKLVIRLVHMHIGGRLIQDINFIKIVILIQKGSLVFWRDRWPALVKLMPFGCISDPLQHIGLSRFEKLIIVQIVYAFPRTELILRTQHVVLVTLMSIIIFLRFTIPIFEF